MADADRVQPKAAGISSFGPAENRRANPTCCGDAWGIALDSALLYVADRSGSIPVSAVHFKR